VGVEFLPFERVRDEGGAAELQVFEAAGVGCAFGLDCELVAMVGYELAIEYGGVGKGDSIGRTRRIGAGS
jgi:hypothetical protein